MTTPALAPLALLTAALLASPGIARAATEGGDPRKQVIYAVVVGQPHPATTEGLEERARKAREKHPGKLVKVARRAERRAGRSFGEALQGWLRERGWEILPADTPRRAPALTGLLTLVPYAGDREEGPFSCKYSLRWIDTNDEIKATSQLQSHGTREDCQDAFLEQVYQDLGAALDGAILQRWFNLKVLGLAYGQQAKLKRALLDQAGVTSVEMRSADATGARWECQTTLSLEALGRTLERLRVGKEAVRVTALNETDLQLSVGDEAPPAASE